MTRLPKLFAALILALAAAAAGAAENSTIGVVVMHGKWGSPQHYVNGLADTLRQQGFHVAVPEMPWSGRRTYDKSVEEADAEIDAEIAKLRDQGAKQIFLAGHSLGAAFALHYVTRTTINGMIAIAPGHRPEGKVYVELLGDDVKKARELAASGKNREQVWFVDLNTGNRRGNIKASVASFLSHFDPQGPMNMARNVTMVKPEVPVLWLVPTREEQPARKFVVQLYSKLPPNPGNQFAEPNSDHVQAPTAAATGIIDWIRATAAKN